MGNNGDNNGEPMEESWSSGSKDLRSQILDLRSDPGATWSSNKNMNNNKKALHIQHILERITEAE